MKRRRALTLIGAVALFPASTLAQRTAVPFIGFLSAGSPHERSHLVAAFRQGLKESGFVDGKDVAIEYRWAESHYERLRPLADELAQRQVAVIVPWQLAAKAPPWLQRRRRPPFPLSSPAVATRSALDWWRALAGPAATSPA